MLEILPFLEGPATSPASLPERGDIEAPPGTPLRSNYTYDPKTLDYDETVCSICLEDFQLGESIYKTPCRHIYHLDCIKINLQTIGPDCPKCRGSIHWTV